ncbi:MAG: hypothetical protein AB8C13_07490 [Phycisphaerales bacterium]
MSPASVIRTADVSTHQARRGDCTAIPCVTGMIWMIAQPRRADYWLSEPHTYGAASSVEQNQPVVAHPDRNDSCVI